MAFPALNSASVEIGLKLPYLTVFGVNLVLILHAALVERDFIDFSAVLIVELNLLDEVKLIPLELRVS